MPRAPLQLCGNNSCRGQFNVGRAAWRPRRTLTYACAQVRLRPKAEIGGGPCLALMLGGKRLEPFDAHGIHRLLQSVDVRDLPVGLYHETAGDDDAEAAFVRDVVPLLAGHAPVDIAA